MCMCEHVPTVTWSSSFGGWLITHHLHHDASSSHVSPPAHWQLLCTICLKIQLAAPVHDIHLEEPPSPKLGGGVMKIVCCPVVDTTMHTWGQCMSTACTQPKELWHSLSLITYRVIGLPSQTRVLSNLVVVTDGSPSPVVDTTITTAPFSSSSSSSRFTWRSLISPCHYAEWITNNTQNIRK